VHWQFLFKLVKMTTKMIRLLPLQLVQMEYKIKVKPASIVVAHVLPVLRILPTQPKLMV
jgi:hypothetical protein